MGRTKHMMRGPKPFSQIDLVHFKDPFPHTLVDALSALPSDVPSERDEYARPAKRTRVDDPKTIVIARETLTISRPSSRRGAAQPPLVLSHPNASQRLRLHFREPSRYVPVTDPSTIRLSSASAQLPGSFLIEVLVAPAELPAKLRAILHVASDGKDAATTEGGLWTVFGVDFERSPGTDRLRLSFEVKWNSSADIDHGMRSTAQRNLSGPVLEALFPSPGTVDSRDLEPLTPQAFYDAAHVPDRDEISELPLSASNLSGKLYPFQHRALKWLLRREGVCWSETLSKLEPCRRTPDTLRLPISFRMVHDADGEPFYVSKLFHVVTRDVRPYSQLEELVSGGILAEEMGLGKTVETIALIDMHRRSPQPSSALDPHTSQQVRPTGATLIVAPSSLKKQWLSEFDRHAPHLRVMTYDGIKSYLRREDQLLADMAEHDVVITTYTVLQAELHFAEEPPGRSRRHERAYARPKSPLIQFSWWRVCIDEAQQIESGVGKAAKTARLIPRINAWGVTGTPVKENIKDLWGLLLFLRYEPFASNTPIWTSMTDTHRDLFKDVFGRIALRHSKRYVRAELYLPPQKRFVISMPFTAIEEQHYQTQFQALVRSCGLDSQGNPVVDDWHADQWHDLMKKALAQLRQTVLHPELGPRRVRTNAQKNQPLRTIAEVLDAMIEQSEASIKSDQRSYLANKLKAGQVFENSPRVKEALTLWQECLPEAEAAVEESREQLRLEIEAAKAAGIEVFDDDEGSDSASTRDTDAEKAFKRVGEARRRLRSALDILHRTVFFIASAYFQIKSNEDMTKPDSDEFLQLGELETSGYERAKSLRQELLQEVQGRASRYMAGMEKSANTQRFVEIPEFKLLKHKGLESRRVADEFEQLSEVLNDQANLLDEWREQVVQLLLRPLVDEEGEVEITGDEYQDSTEIQDLLMAFTLALRAVIGDRLDALNGQINDRVRVETRTAERLAENGDGPAPEKVLELLATRKELKPSPALGSLRRVVTTLREIAAKLRHDAASGSHRAAVELEIVQQQLQSTQDQINKQTKAVAALEKELDRFTAAMNARVEFYRQLQAISDTVAPLDETQDEENGIGHDDALYRGMIEEGANLQQKIVVAQSKHRYLLHLKDAGVKSQESSFCVICQESFSIGVLTICGHQFCKECITMWFRAHRSCPTCKRALTMAMLNDITFKKQELRLHEDQSHGPAREPLSPSRSRHPGIYSNFGLEKLEAINNIELDGPSFGTKIDTMVRHLLWLREADPGAKSIIFSQFGGFLDVLGQAFERYRIGHSSFGGKSDGITQFKENPAIECFLMDARAHASGLNLVNASHVFLCEPMLNTALELQAIARVDRIGQEHQTTVWLYLVEGTVEASIYALSVQRRLEHMSHNVKASVKGKEKELSATTPEGEVTDLNLEAANSMELEQAALTKLMNRDKQLGEEIDKNDVWECLFGHVKAGSSALAASQQAMDDRFHNSAVMGFLAREAAEARRDGAE